MAVLGDSPAGDIDVLTVNSRRRFKQFLKLPFALYRDDPHWVPPLLIAERERLDRRRNPFFEHAEMELFLAFQEGEPVARIVAIDDSLHNQTHDENVAFFGFFEAASAAAASVVLRSAEAWGAGRGRDAVRGPMNPSLNDSAGLLTLGFDDDPSFMIPYNPPEYASYIEAGGYRKLKDLLCWDLEIQKPFPERMLRIADRVRKRFKPIVRSVDMKHFERELITIRDIFRETWKDNWGFVPPTAGEFGALATNLKRLLDPELAMLIDIDGRTVAFSVSLPDLNQVFKHMNGRLLPWGFLKLLNRQRYIDRSRMPLLGVLPEFRMKGLELLLIIDSKQRAAEMGYQRGECSWTLEDNRAINNTIQALGCWHSKTYRIYQKPLS